MTRQCTSFLHKDSHLQVQMTSGSAMLEKSDKMTSRSEWTPWSRKFSKKSFLAFSSWNRTWEETGGREKDDLKPWRGFWAGVDLHYLGAIKQSIRERERERERENRRKHMFIVDKKRTYAWTCVTWEFKSIIGKTQSKPNSIHINNQAHI